MSKFNTDTNEKVPPPHSRLEQKQYSTVQNITDLLSTDFAKKREILTKHVRMPLKPFFVLPKRFQTNETKKKSQTQNINKKNTYVKNKNKITNETKTQTQNINKKNHIREK